MTPFRTAPSSRDTREVFYWQGYLHTLDGEAEKMYTEDIAGLDRITEEEILDQLRNRLERGNSYTFVGDVLLFVNPNGSKPEIHRDVGPLRKKA
jgi:myosin III